MSPLAPRPPRGRPGLQKATEGRGRDEARGVELRPELAAGINLNDLGLPDPSAGGQGIWLDPVAGSAVRQGLPARIERVG